MSGDSLTPAESAHNLFSHGRQVEHTCPDPQSTLLTNTEAGPVHFPPTLPRQAAVFPPSGRKHQLKPSKQGSCTEDAPPGGRWLFTQVRQPGNPIWGWGLKSQRSVSHQELEMEWQQIQIHPLGGIPGGSVPCHQDPPCPVCAGASREVSVRDKCVLSSQTVPGVHSVHTLQQAESGSQVEE